MSAENIVPGLSTNNASNPAPLTPNTVDAAMAPLHSPSHFDEPNCGVLGHLKLRIDMNWHCVAVQLIKQNGSSCYPRET